MYLKSAITAILVLCGVVLVSAQQEIPRPSEVDDGYKTIFSQFYLDFDRDDQVDILIVWENAGQCVLQIWSVMKNMNLLVHDLGDFDFEPSLLDFRAISAQNYLLVGSIMFQYSPAQFKKKIIP